MGRTLVLLAFLIPGVLIGQSTSSPPEDASLIAPTAIPDEAFTTKPAEAYADEGRLRSYVDFRGDSNSLGQILTVDFGLGYQFNPHISVDGNVPFYYVSTSSTTTDINGVATTSTTSDQGIGDPSFALSLRFPNRILDYRTNLTTWVPVASMSSGFTTGSVLVDWTSHLSRPVGRLTPFGQIDIGNTVPDTSLFLLPYTAQGLNTRFEAGTEAMLTKIFSAGASFYYVLPSGNQTLYSREIHTAGTGSGGGTGGTGGSGTGSGGTGTGSGSGSGGSGSGSGQGSGSVVGYGPRPMVGGSGTSGGYKNGFTTQQVTEGSDLTRDHGGGGWLTANFPHFIDLHVGFNRSVDYDLNTVSFGVGFDPVRAFRRAK